MMCVVLGSQDVKVSVLYCILCVKVIAPYCVVFESQDAKVTASRCAFFAGHRM